MGRQFKVLVLDDEEHIRFDLSNQLGKIGYGVFTASTVEGVRKIIKSEMIDFALVDLKIDHNDEYGGIIAIKKISKVQPRTRIIVLSAHPPQQDILDQLKAVSYDGYIYKGDPDKNYILAVIDRLEFLTDKPKPKKCFVIMPFSKSNSCSKKEWTEIFRKMIKPAIEESDYDYQCFRGKLKMGNIIKAVIDKLNTADIVIAELTDKNPNVFYELGVRHAIQDGTILIAQDMDHVPFDLRGFGVITYNWKTQDGRNIFKKEISKILKKLEDDPDDPDLRSPIHEYLN